MNQARFHSGSIWCIFALEENSISWMLGWCGFSCEIDSKDRFGLEWNQCGVNLSGVDRNGRELNAKANGTQIFRENMIQVIVDGS